MKSRFSVSNLSRGMALLLSHQMVSSVAASRTTNLSDGLRPVWEPVETTSAPPSATTASLRAIACW
jgi:hypothetical protein